MYSALILHVFSTIYRCSLYLLYVLSSGIYLAEETFMDLKYTQEEQRKEIQELLLKMKMMEEKRDTMQTVFSELNKNLEIKASELQNTRDKLSNARTQLANTHNVSNRLPCCLPSPRHIIPSKLDKNIIFHTNNSSPLEFLLCEGYHRTITSTHKPNPETDIYRPRPRPQ